MSNIRCLYLFTHSGVQHILCCFCFVFLCLVYRMLSVYLDCPVLIGPSVFSNVYYIWRFYLSNKKTRRKPIGLNMIAKISHLCMRNEIYIVLFKVHHVHYPGHFMSWMLNDVYGLLNLNHHYFTINCLYWNLTFMFQLSNIVYLRLIKLEIEIRWSGH